MTHGNCRNDPTEGGGPWAGSLPSSNGISTSRMTSTETLAHTKVLAELTNLSSPSLTPEHAAGGGTVLQNGENVHSTKMSSHIVSHASPIQQGEIARLTLMCDLCQQK